MLAVSLADGNLGSVMKWAALEKRQDDHVALGGRWAHDDIYGYIGPGSTRDWERLKQARSGLMEGLVLGADGASPHKLQSIIVHSGTPKSPLQYLQSTGYTRMTGEWARWST